MKSKFIDLKIKVIELRKKGKTFSEITSNLNTSIPKSTLSNWCKDLTLTKHAHDILESRKAIQNKKARVKAVQVNKVRHSLYLKNIDSKYAFLENSLNNKRVALVSLAMLYFGEGSKNINQLCIGNSNPKLIQLFLYLLRLCYPIDERKFRCTIQCRADQDIEKLLLFWVKITNIPKEQFYKTRKDPRTIGIPSRKADYMGVCRLEYLSSDLYYNIMSIIDTITRACSLEEKR